MDKTISPPRYRSSVAMGNRSQLSMLRLISLVLLLLAVILTTLQLVRFSRIRAYFPDGLKIAEVPVGGLDRQQAVQRLLEVYSLPVELHYVDAVVQLNPSVIDFQLDLDSMLAAADLERTQNLFWEDFWNYLWGRTPTPLGVPLRATFSEPRLTAYLNEIAQRYDQPPEAAMPVPGTVNFQAGRQGISLDVSGSVPVVENALRSIDHRSVILPIQRSNPGRPAFNSLEILLQQTIKVSGFDGLVGLYLVDLQNAQEIHFAYQNGDLLPVEPDIAFTASSIIKVPIMISAFRHMQDTSDQETMSLMNDMIVNSGNEVADWLMNRVLDPRRGPLVVTDDMKALGLKSTYLAGYFTAGSPLLATIKTPANQRSDVNTDPDPYSQTTPSDISMLLEDLYMCEQTGGGTLMAVFPTQITQAKCQMMVNYLKNNKLPVLLTAGLPEGTQIAHKHGWVSTQGVINTIGDAGIIYTPGGNYVLAIFMHHPVQLIWDPASTLVAKLSQAVYNYYNPPSQ
jgi:beta-lactamase class A